MQHTESAVPQYDAATIVLHWITALLVVVLWCPDIRAIPDLACNEEAVLADIVDRPAMEQMVAGREALVHLAGLGGSGDLEALFWANVRGLFDVLETARLGDIKRIVFASSNHAFHCYPIDVPVSPDMPPRPDSLYGAFKVLGETMLRTSGAGSHRYRYE